jgi:S-adenosyl-L-methionine hydrolase (adenosine-forming)
MIEPGIITLMTDFGGRDSYVGSMKGVILSINPDIRIVDISHQVSAFNLASAAYMLATYYSLYPPGTVHVAVVDPGVGGPRSPMAVALGGYYFVLPDNGLLTMVMDANKEGCRAHFIENRELMRDSVSATFHGRDIFAPAAARLATGFSFDEVGPVILRPAILQSATVAIGANAISGAVVHIDHFGNYITNITEDHLGRFDGPPLLVRIGSFTMMGLSRTFSDNEQGELLAYIGSTGHLEIAMSRGSACEAVGLPAGAEVTVRWRDAAG